MIMNKNKIMIAVIILFGALATILGFIGALTPVWLTLDVSVNNDMFSNDLMPSEISNHASVAFIGGLIAAIAGLGILAFGTVVAVMEYKGTNNMNMVALISVIVLALVMFILGAVATAFNRDLDDAMWIAEHAVSSLGSLTTI